MNKIPIPIKYEKSPIPLYSFRNPKPFTDKYIFSIPKIYIISKKLKISCKNDNLDCSDIIKLIDYYHGTKEYNYRITKQYFANEEFKKELTEALYNKKKRNVGTFIGMNLDKHWELVNQEELEKKIFCKNEKDRKYRKYEISSRQIITKRWVNNNINIYPGG